MDGDRHATMGSPDEARFLLVRTGPTEWDEAGRVCGSADIPLSRTAREEIERAIRSLGGVRLGMVLHPAREAAVETAKLLAAVTGSRRRTAPALEEPSLGLWEGRLASELEENFPTSYRQWRADPASVLPPEGEGLVHARGRIVGAIGRAIGRRGETDPPLAVVLGPLAAAIVTSRAVGAAENRNGRCCAPGIVEWLGWPAPGKRRQPAPAGNLTER
jgi:broad specificity phosphatase PhoE